jgi:hypothetical protein
MHTLNKIRATQKENDKIFEERRKNYKSPTGFMILTKFMKDKNMDVAKQTCEELAFDPIKTSEIVEKYSKLSYYTPIVTRIIEKETEFIEDNKS